MKNYTGTATSFLFRLEIIVGELSRFVERKLYVHIEVLLGMLRKVTSWET
jgi:hypothetical protein